MNDPIKTITGVSLGGAVVLFALYGKQFWDSALGAWLFLLKITDTAPLGLASFLAALILATMLELALDRWLPLRFNKDARRFAIEFLSLLGAVAVSWVQLHELNGLLFGILAGLMAPLLARALSGLGTYVGQRFRAQA